MKTLSKIKRGYINAVVKAEDKLKETAGSVSTEKGGLIIAIIVIIAVIIGLGKDTVAEVWGMIESKLLGLFN